MNDLLIARTNAKGNRRRASSSEFGGPRLSSLTTPPSAHGEGEHVDVAHAITQAVLGPFFETRSENSDRMAKFGDAVLDVVKAEEEGLLSESDREAVLQWLATVFVAGNVSDLFHSLTAPNTPFYSYEPFAKRSNR